MLPEEEGQEMPGPPRGEVPRSQTVHMRATLERWERDLDEINDFVG